MREANSPWKVSVAVDPKLIGAVNLRLVAKKIAGEETPASYEIPRSLYSTSTAGEPTWPSLTFPV